MVGPKVTDVTHAALLRPLGPIVRALTNGRAEMASSLQTFRDLFRRNELHKDIAEGGKGFLGGIEP